MPPPSIFEEVVKEIDEVIAKNSGEKLFKLMRDPEKLRVITALAMQYMDRLKDVIKSSLGERDAMRLRVAISVMSSICMTVANIMCWIENIESNSKTNSEFNDVIYR